jgi:hypothetical protein
MFGHLARMALRAPVLPLDQELRQQQTGQPSELVPEGEFLVGLSIGQGLQPTGVAVLERFMPQPAATSRSYACRYLRRWLPPATAYPVLVSNLKGMLSDTPLRHSALVVEAGPGIKAVVAFLRKHRLPAHIQPVEVRAGAEDNYVEGTWRTAKADVIETTRQVLQEGRLVFDDRMPPEVMATTPSAQTIYHALLTYPYNKTPAANDAFASREGADDDLILAVALASWFGECCCRTLWVR